jgi:Raf kinase inhibitor-like YbhB/YbcL family protein
MRLSSPAFAEGGTIPRRHTADGADVSPALTWSEEPAGTVELALIVDDPDAPTPEPWVHWVAYRIAPGRFELPEGIPRKPTPGAPPGMMQGVNSFSGDNIGFRGPAPPRGGGVHRYRFTLHALDGALDLAAGASKEEVLRAMDGRILATARLTGTYER